MYEHYLENNYIITNLTIIQNFFFKQKQKKIGVCGDIYTVPGNTSSSYVTVFV